MSSFIVFHFIFLRQGLSENLDLTDRLDWLTSELLGPSCLHPPMVGPQTCTVNPTFYVSAGNPNSGPYTYPAGSLPTGPSPQTLDRLLSSPALGSELQATRWTVDAPSLSVCSGDTTNAVDHWVYKEPEQGWGDSSVAKCLPCMWEVLSSIPSTRKIRERQGTEAFFSLLSRLHPGV